MDITYIITLFEIKCMCGQLHKTEYLNVIGAQRPRLKIPRGAMTGTNRVGNPPQKYMQSLLFFFIVTVL